MEPRRLTGWLALIVVACVVAVLIYLDTGRKPDEPLPASVSTSEPAPPDEPATASGPSEAVVAPPETTVTEAPPPPDAAPVEPPASTADAPRAPAEPPSAPTDAAASDPSAAPAAGPPAAPEVAMVEPPPAPGEAADGAPEAGAGPSEQIAPAPASEPPPAALSPSAVPSFDIVRVEPSGETVVAGQATPNARVEILDGDVPIAVAEANESGEWAMALDKPLPSGTHDLAIRTTSEDEKVVTLSDQRVAVAVPSDGSRDVLVVLNSPETASRILQEPEPPPAETMQELPAAQGQATASPASDGSAKSTDMASAPDTTAEPEGQGAPAPAPMAEDTAADEPTPRASEPPAAKTEEAAPATLLPQVGIAAVEAETSGALFVAGTTNQTGPLRVYVNDELVGEALPNQSGSWLLQAKRELAPGQYKVRVDNIDRATGEVVARAEVPFEREVEVTVLKPVGEAGAATGASTSGSMPELQTIIIKRGDNLWRLSRAWYGKGVRWSTLYAANKDQIRNPRWIYPGQVFLVPTGDASWKQ